MTKLISLRMSQISLLWTLYGVWSYIAWTYGFLIFYRKCMFELKQYSSPFSWSVIFFAFIFLDHFIFPWTSLSHFREVIRFLGVYWPPSVTVLVQRFEHLIREMYLCVNLSRIPSIRSSKCIRCESGDAPPTLYHRVLPRSSSSSLFHTMKISLISWVGTGVVP